MTQFSAIVPMLSAAVMGAGAPDTTTIPADAYTTVSFEKAPNPQARTAAMSIGNFEGCTYETQSIRESFLFDDDWRFHLGDCSGGERDTFDDTSWRKIDLPHDWSVEDLPPNERANAFQDAVRGKWRFNKGDNFEWKDSLYDDSAWQIVDLPATWEDHSDYRQDNVYGWFRRRVFVDTLWRGKPFVLGLGTIDDVDETFFNGTKIGQSGTFPPSFVTAYRAMRFYHVPSELIHYGEENDVAVRVFDALGAGGIYRETPPHTQSGPFEAYAVGGRSTGYTRGGTGWYRKDFIPMCREKDRRVYLRFDGVYMNADVWVNGLHLGNHPYGYTSFGYDITRFVKLNERNVVAVQVKNEGRNTRWYSGSGIYRHVWLTVTGPVHFEHWGTVITTPVVSTDSAAVHIKTTVSNQVPERVDLTLTTDILDRKGNTVASVTTTGSIQAKGTLDMVQECGVGKPSLWDIDTPHLYTARSTLLAGDKTLDSTETVFGIRSILFDVKTGFHLNGRSMKLKGACMHHDNGCLGAAAFDRAERRRVEIMKSNGYNAIRTAHNPPSPAFLDACDDLGVLVIDEAFDAWNVPKQRNDYSVYFRQWWQRDLNSMLLRDRNHPCVIAWSIGNEIPEEDKPLGIETSRMLANHVRTVDPTRPVTAALCAGHVWDSLDDNFHTLDIGGYNYQIDKYDADHARVPSRIMIATESYPSRAYDYWKAVQSRPFLIGDFVWTGMDYLGESGIGWGTTQYPWTNAFCGDIDLCGFKLPASHFRDALWDPVRRVYIVVRNPGHTYGVASTNGAWEWEDVHASWNWPGHEGRNMRIRVYSSCDRVQLLLNERDLGTRVPAALVATWDVPYEPGVLTAIGYAGSGKAAECHLRTAGAPAAITLAADRRLLKADGQDLCFVKAEVLDSKGVLNPVAETTICFSLDGPGRLIAVGTGNPVSAESFQSRKRKSWHGYCLAVIRTTRQTGSLTVTAKADGLKPATVRIESR